MRHGACAAALVLALLALMPGPNLGAQDKAVVVDEDTINRAIERGVAALRKLQDGDGTYPPQDWPLVTKSAYSIGAAALAGLTLLECDVKSDDKAVKAIADAVRKASPTLTNTYALSLAVLFLDRLDNPADTPLIESMVLRLLAGQNARGSWGYLCPPADPADMPRLKAVAEGKGAELVGRRGLPKLPPKGDRKAAHLSREIQDQLAKLNAGGGGGGAAPPTPPDNSNTQFAALALWAGRRYGVPAQAGLLRTDGHFRATQHRDGGWGYDAMMMAPIAPLAPVGPVGPGGAGAGLPGGGGAASTATMTCAGILGLAYGHGGVVDLTRARDGKIKPRDITKDDRLMAGLRVLGTAIGGPDRSLEGPGPKPAIPAAGGKAYYLLWSIERVGVALDLKTIGKKDWYTWGAEVLLANQRGDGSWQGDYGACGADTCFALLFLKRANLTRDLTSRLKGLKDPGERSLRGGIVGKAGLKEIPDKPLEPAGIGKKPAEKEPLGKEPAEKEPPVKRPSTGREEGPAARLGKELARTSAEGRTEVLRKLRDGKGSDYTDALVGAIPKLEGQALREARQALAERLARMKVNTLRAYLKDEDPEVRRAAALASTAKDDGKMLVPDLIRLLSDREAIVERAAYAALKELSGKDFGPTADASRAERARAIANWLAWWKKTARE